MGRHIVRLPLVCPDCGGGGIRSYVAVSGSSLHTSASFRCEKCGGSDEWDGELTDAARMAFYRVEGEWELRVEEPGPSRIDVLRVLREVTPLAPTDAADVLRGARAVLRGIQAEVEQVGDVLRRAGAAVAMRRVE
jgi:hypothetical protein